MRCAKCNTDNRDTAKFCDKCGARLSSKCPSCGAENRPDARFCDSCGSALVAGATAATAKPNDGPIRVADASAGDNLGGERKTVTALFADIKGSTELMEDLDPEEARAIVDPALKLMIEAVRHYDGYVVQSIGDGIFALFGAPVAHEDHPQRALFAALRIQEELRRHSDRVRAEGGLPIQARVGVHTGEVVVRSIATGAGKAEYTPIGHTANLASRMQTLAPIGSIAATDAARKLCEGYFTFKALGPTRVKGLAEAVNVYEVTGLGPLRTRLQRAAGRGLTKFVGREREMEALKHALEQAANGHGQIVGAMGDPGVGKSRLFFEFKAVAQSGCLVLEAYSVSHGKASAYLPVTELLREYFRIVPEDDPRQRRRKVIGRVLELDRSLEETLPYVFALLGVQEADDALAQMDAQIRRRRTLDALKRILLRESLNQPLILVFEDLHWIDAQTQELLNLIADAIANARVLLLVNYRPEYRHDWGHRTHYTQLRLDPLGEESAENLLSAQVGDAAELAPLKRMIIDRTQGNPFFIEEMVQTLFDDGVLVRNGSVKLAGLLSQVRVPPTVQGVLAARIDRLTPPEKGLLQTLAVMGRDFPLTLVRKVWAGPDEELERMLANLQLGEFIYEQPAVGDTEYVFKHALTQEVAGNSLLTERRKLLHERVARAMEELFAEHIDDHLNDLAYHYRRSDNTMKAIEYLVRAGVQATPHGFYEEAIELLNGALALLPQIDDGTIRDTQELAVRRALMAPLIAVRPISAADNVLNVERIRELCEKTGETRLLARVLGHLFFVHLSELDWAETELFVREALDLAGRTSDEHAIYVGNFVAGMSAVYKGEYLAAHEHFERASRVSDQTQAALLRDPSIALGVVNCMGYLASLWWILGYPERARLQTQRVTAVLGPTLDPYAHCVGVLHILATCCWFFRDYRGARAQAEELLARSIRNGILLITPVTLVLMGRIMVSEGDPEAGIRKVEEGLPGLEATGNIGNYDLNSYFAVAACLEAGRISQGMALAERAIVRATAGGVRFYEADLHRLKGELILAAGGPASEAEAAFREAIEIARRQQAKSFELRGATSLARLLRDTGRRDEARTMLAEIYNWFTEGFDTRDLMEAKALLEELST
ncbi:MAG TPA: adenylate/guanylate cyclase domain-containing protein [Candidatus Binataceae bacterium]|nr:adenylate/guanylate cyclase domain-containing protein [Candidatus Binataceae bacterium]